MQRGYTLLSYRYRPLPYAYNPTPSGDPPENQLDDCLGEIHRGIPDRHRTRLFQFPTQINEFL